jgi:hypothetical protein
MATTRSTPNRPVVGYLFLLAGALTLLGVVLNYAAKGANLGWLGTLTDAALAVAFLFLFLGRTADLLARVAFIVAAVGWALIAIGNLGVTLGLLALVAVVLALVGSLVAGILVFQRRIFSRRANLSFLLAMIFAALIILNTIANNFFGVLVGVIVVVYGVLLVVAGLFIAQRR